MDMVNKNLRRRGCVECGQALLRNTSYCLSKLCGQPGAQRKVVHKAALSITGFLRRQILDHLFGSHFSHGYFGIQRQDVRIMDHTVHNGVSNCWVREQIIP